MDYKKLKSGTDIRGTALGENADLTETAVAALARGFVKFIGKPHPVVAVGHDSRVTAQVLKNAVIDALSAGATVLDCGLCSTPSMFMTTKTLGADGAIMLTASHHPYDKNGMKFFTPKGGVDGAELSAIIDAACEESSGEGEIIVKDFLEEYCALMREFFIKELGEKPLKGIKIAVDAGNGSAGFYAERILAPLGADISGSQYLEPDGYFPFHQPNPENKEAMDSISRRVKETESDLGVIFDTDGDRVAIVLSDGTEINRNRLIALISAVVLRDNPGAYIVTDSVTSDGLHEFITALGGVHVRYKRGYNNVIGFAKKLTAEGKNAPLAIETSGHAALKENYFLDDGAYLAAKLIVEAVKLKREGKTLASLTEGLKVPAEEAEIRLKLTGENWKEDAASLIADLTEWAKKYSLAPDNYEGVRANVGDGWFLARMSVHDPVIPVNIESESVGGTKCIAALLLEFMRGRKGIDLSPLENFCK